MELTERREQLSEEARAFIHGQSVEAARAELESMMDKAGLSEASRERLRDAFRGTTSTAGMRQAINIEKRGGK